MHLDHCFNAHDFGEIQAETNGPEQTKGTGRARPLRSVCDFYILLISIRS